MHRPGFLFAIVFAVLAGVPGFARSTGGDLVVGLPQERGEREAQEPAYPHALIFGQVVDLDGRPLEGVEVRLGSVGERWVSKDLHPAKLTGFRITTDTRGTFEFDMPVPTSSWTTLSLRPSEFHTRDGREFGLAGGRDEEPLRAGDNDLGIFVLAPAGVIEGRIADAAGAYILEAYARLEKSGGGGFVMNSNRVGADGVYRIAHIPAGRREAEVLAEGFLSGRRKDIVVVEGEVTAGVDFVLGVAPTLSGHVFDAQGRPLAGVSLRGWPVEGGQTGRATSAEDGSFTMTLTENKPYSLHAELERYEGFDRMHGGPSFAPGRSDIEIVLHQRDLVTFAVRDAVTDAPITSFGLNIIRVRSEHGSSSSSSHQDPAPVTEHPGGVVELPGDIQYDDYTIVAPGFGPQRSDVWFDEGATGRQTIRLVRAGAITGRLVRGAEPVARPALSIRADRIALRPGVTEGEDDIFSEDWGADLDKFAGQRRNTTGAEDGTFRIEDLAPGTYVLRVSGPGLAPRAVRGVRVAAGETTDLGDVEAFAPSEIHGQIVLAGGVAPGGLIVAPGDADRADSDKAVTTDARGSFEFTGLAEGTHFLWVEARPGVLVRGGPTEVELGLGEIKVVRLDLSDRIPCTLEVRVLVNGQPAEGVSVSASPVPAPRREFPVGVADAAGLIVGHMLGNGPSVLTVKGTGQLLIGTGAEPVDLRPGEQRSVELVFDAGQLSVTAPSSLLESGSQVFFMGLQVRRLEEEASWQYVPVYKSTWSVSGQEIRADLGWIAPGRYEARMHAGSLVLTGAFAVAAGGQVTCMLAE